jgi:hypothetical protein
VKGHVKGFEIRRAAIFRHRSPAVCDTEHLQTIKWNSADYVSAQEELKAAIRNTSPLEAKMTDDSGSQVSHE